MNEERDAEFLGFRPYRMKLLIGKLLAGDVAANCSALKTVFADCDFELFHGEIGELQRERRECG